MDLGDVSVCTPPPKLPRSQAADTPWQPLRGKQRQGEKLRHSAQPEAQRAAKGAEKSRDARKRETHRERNIQQLPANDPDRLHFLGCPLSDCNRCYFAMYKRSWMSKLLVDAGRPEHGTWVRSEVVNGAWALRCQTCRAAGVKSVFATSGLGNSAPMLRLTTLLNHAKAKCHLSATGRAEDPSSRAPTHEHFLDVLNAVRDGKSDGDKGVLHVGKRWKIRRMKFCLAEAKRALMRSALASAKVIALHQDCRAAKLAVRYVSVDSKLQVSKGVLGCLDLKQCDALGLRDATLKIVHDACVPFHHAPSSTAVKQSFEAHVFDNVVKTIELFDADAASDETLAGRLLRGIRPGSSEESAFTSAFPNLKEFRAVKLKFTEKDAATFFYSIDRTRSLANMCGC